MNRFIVLLISFSVFNSSASSLDIKKARNYIEERFENARVEIDPYPHVVIDDILPIEIYNELEKYLPQNLQYVDIFDSNHNGSVWHEFAELISDQIIKIKVTELFRPYISYRFGVDINEKFICFPKKISEGHQMAANYHIKPHIDQGYFFAQVLLYMPINESDQGLEAGTRLYTHNSNYTTLDVEYVRESDVQIAKIIPYKKNSLFAFMRTPNSWHGSYQPKNVSRRFYITGIYLSPQFMKSWYNTTFGLNRTLDEDNLF